MELYNPVSYLYDAIKIVASGRRKSLMELKLRITDAKEVIREFESKSGIKRFFSEDFLKYHAAKKCMKKRNRVRKNALINLLD